ncbi:RNA-binding protein PNO1 [Oryzias melastigma]|uniref:RNA-binding protein PNO1 n=1 Tax=Oryzias melastigma TaxID=30732 RepID=A0A834CDG1_ORYME|nr:RNA-binding protein PNO1 [Oryzias melastigma]
MDASENGAAAPEKRDDAESFTKVKSKKSQKRKLEPDGGTMEVEEPNKRPHFPPISADKLRGPDEMRKIAVPAHRYTPLKDNWLKIFTPIVENLQLQVRFNLKTRNVEIKVSFLLALRCFLFCSCCNPSPLRQTCKETQDIAALTKAADFVKAFVLGFQVDVSPDTSFSEKVFICRVPHTLTFLFQDAMALIRLDELFLESFDVTDGKITVRQCCVCRPTRALKFCRCFCSEATEGRPPVQSHRENRREGRKNQIHHRKRHKDSHRTRRHKNPHFRFFPEYQDGPDSDMQFNLRKSTFKGLREHQSCGQQDRRAILSRDWLVPVVTFTKGRSLLLSYLWGSKVCFLICSFHERWTSDDMFVNKSKENIPASFFSWMTFLQQDGLLKTKR